MLLLVTDTSGKDGFVGLAHAGEGAAADEVDVIEEVPLAGGTFSAQLVPQILGLLDKHGFRKSDVGAFIVVSGPGSFTGLRVGLAAIKALAEILQKPIVPVSLLEVVARHSNFSAAGGSEPPKSRSIPFAVALDAGRGEAYIGQYEIVRGNTSGSLRCVMESLLATGSLVGLTQSGAARWLATPDATIADYLSGQAEIKSRVFRTERPRSQKIGSTGWQKLRDGEIVSPEELDANYIRRSDAEIFSKPNG
jgi:tRNA threonylcarbamoyladenosine biosynthesis protein TsaB